MGNEISGLHGAGVRTWGSKLGPVTSTDEWPGESYLSYVSLLICKTAYLHFSMAQKTE